MTLGDRCDDDARTESNIAASEYIRPRRCHGFGVGLQRAPRGEFQIVLGANPGKFRRLTNRQDDRVTVHDFFAAFDELRIEPPILVEHATRFDQLDTGDAPVLADDSFGTPSRAQSDAFLLGFFDFLACGWYFVEVFEAVHVNFRYAFADGFACHVEGDADLVGWLSLAGGQLLQHSGGGV